MEHSLLPEWCRMPFGQVVVDLNFLKLTSINKLQKTKIERASNVQAACVWIVIAVCGWMCMSAHMWNCGLFVVGMKGINETKERQTKRKKK